MGTERQVNWKKNQIRFQGSSTQGHAWGPTRDRSKLKHHITSSQRPTAPVRALGGGEAASI